MNRLGATSYVIPDEILPNVRFAADLVDDVELVLFESDDLCGLPGPETIRELGRIAEDRALSFTVHLPLDTWLGHEDETVRQRSVERCLRVMDRTVPLGPFAWVCHLHGGCIGPVRSAYLARWVRRCRESLVRLTQEVPSKKICVENLDYDFSSVSPVVRSLDLSVCLDVGHCLVHGHDAVGLLLEHLSRIRVVHLHGVRGNRDHLSLRHLDRKFLQRLLSGLAGHPGTTRVFTLEVFSRADLTESLEVAVSLPFFRSLCLP